ncbi:MAG: alanine--tRNA ligase [Rhodospirillales bacterium]|nr:alanine--tRNA ligase [Rhodospirillales bacterium]
MKTINDIRSTFLDFFKGKGHEIVASSPLVPHNDPTLMFTNSGMVQFKNCFLGAEKRPYTRAATAQKCVRAGGKHNDLDNVGYTARHHTFFEMMGNFSFGDYFKDDAIAFAWELVTKHLDLPREKLLVTVHSSDEEAAAIWRKVAGFSDDRILRIDTNDNFWMMGDTGPCGPCSEIFIDQGDRLAGGPPGSPDQDGDRFLEFWNLVFMQFEQEPDGKGGYIRKPLPKPAIDTGMGLERTAAILQGKYSNYDVDLLRAIIEQCADLTGVSPDGPQAASHRVIADHLRASAFLMADGVMPSNEGRGYVLRRIMRRGMRHAHLLGAKDPLMCALFPTLLGMMGEAYPELRRAQALVTETLRIEETRFRRTLETGLKILDEESGKLGAGGTLSGDIAFKLYDTYGFPVDLTADALRGKGLGVDMSGFESAMKKQRETARKSWAGSGEAATDTLWFDVLEEAGASEFLGYDTETAEGQIRLILKDGKRVESAAQGESVSLITNQTPFYAESGGQVGDTGLFLTAQGDAFEVLDTKKMLGKLWVHQGRVTKGSLKTGEGVEMRVDGVRRAAIRANHSATHLLHAALHEHVGAHVTQKGSSVDEHRLRFDVSLNAPLTPDQIEKIERTVNRQILANTEICTRLMPVEDAMEAGAMALFGEKYDEEVRVLSMGTTPPGAARPFSVELCGGTHARRTGDIGLFRLVSDSALSAGVRRIEGLTGTGAFAYLRDQDEKLRALATLLNTAPADVPERVRTLAEDRRHLEKQVADLRRQMASGGGGASGPDIKDIGGVKFIGRVVDLPPRDLKPLADDFKGKMGSGVVALVSTYEGKASLVVGVTSDLTGRFSAVDLVKIGAAALGGQGGGGRPDMAQAGGPDGAAANDAVAAIEAAMA